MSFFIKNLNYYGVTHKVASLELREHFALNDDQIIKAYELSKKFEIHELFILSTCARTEFYAFWPLQRLRPSIKGSCSIFRSLRLIFLHKIFILIYIFA